MFHIAHQSTADFLCESDVKIFGMLRFMDKEIVGKDDQFQEVIMCVTVVYAVDFMTNCEGGTALVTPWLRELRERLVAAKMRPKLVEITKAGMAKDEPTLKKLCSKHYPKV